MLALSEVFTPTIIKGIKQQRTMREVKDTVRLRKKVIMVRDGKRTKFNSMNKCAIFLGIPAIRVSNALLHGVTINHRGKEVYILRG